MSDLKAQEFYQLYRKKTIEAGYTPIGRQRFTGIIKTISLIPDTFDYLRNKANDVSDTHEQALPIRDVSGSVLIDLNMQVKILKKVIDKLMITFDNEDDRIDYILDIVNEYKKQVTEHYR